MQLLGIQHGRTVGVVDKTRLFSLTSQQNITPCLSTTAEVHELDDVVSFNCIASWDLLPGAIIYAQFTCMTAPP